MVFLCRDFIEKILFCSTSSGHILDGSIDLFTLHCSFSCHYGDLIQEIIFGSASSGPVLDGLIDLLKLSRSKCRRFNLKEFCERWESKPRIEPGDAVWEAWTLPLCYASPPPLKQTFVSRILSDAVPMPSAADPDSSSPAGIVSWLGSRQTLIFGQFIG